MMNDKRLLNISLILMSVSVFVAVMVPVYFHYEHKAIIKKFNETPRPLIPTQHPNGTITYK